jgi:hypothetical protein
MASIKLIADSGATKAEWCLLHNGKKKTIFTQGISPYFLNTEQIIDLLRQELLPKLKKLKSRKFIITEPVAPIFKMLNQ